MSSLGNFIRSSLSHSRGGNLRIAAACSNTPRYTEEIYNLLHETVFALRAINDHTGLQMATSGKQGGKRAALGTYSTGPTTQLTKVSSFSFIQTEQHYGSKTQKSQV